MCRMRLKPLAIAAFAALCLTTIAAQAASPTPSATALGKIVPGESSKADIKTLLGEPWRVVQFNDCGEAMDGQDDETWEYRGTDAGGGFRLHVEFNDHGMVHLLAKIPDDAPGGAGTAAKVEVGGSSMGGMSM